MKSHYHIDAEKVSLTSFHASLKSRDLVPSRAVLKENCTKRFKIIALAGVNSLSDLIDNLKTKKKIEEFSNRTGLNIEYLTLLKREASSLFPNPIQLKSFPSVRPQTLQKLETGGIKNSKQLFDKVQFGGALEEICSKTGLKQSELEELYQLSDLSRLYGVGPVFARILYDIGIRSVKMFLEHGADEIVRIYEIKKGIKADFSARDIQFALELARELELKIETRA